MVKQRGLKKDYTSASPPWGREEACLDADIRELNIVNVPAPKSWHDGESAIRISDVNVLEDNLPQDMSGCIPGRRTHVTHIGSTKVTQLERCRGGLQRAIGHSDIPEILYEYICEEDCRNTEQHWRYAC